MDRLPTIHADGSILSSMKLTDDQKVEIFCAALNAHIQVFLREELDARRRMEDPVDAASIQASHAIAKLQSKEWEAKN
jgi:hypothetical protein